MARAVRDFIRFGKWPCILAGVLAVPAFASAVPAEEWTKLLLHVHRPGRTSVSKVLQQPLEVPAGMAYRLDVWLDPVERAEGNLQVDPGFAFGLASADAEPSPHRDKSPKIAISVRETSDRGFWSVWIDGVNVSADPPERGNHDNGELQKPNVFAAKRGAYHLALSRVNCSAICWQGPPGLFGSRVVSGGVR